MDSERSSVGPRLLTLAEVADRLRISIKAVRKLARQQIGIVELGKRSVRVRIEDVERFESCACSYGNQTELQPGTAPSPIPVVQNALLIPESTIDKEPLSQPENSSPRRHLLRPTQPKTKPRVSTKR